MKFGLYQGNPIYLKFMKIQLVVFEMQAFIVSIIWGKMGFLPKFKAPYLLNYWVDFDKIGAILKEIVHRFAISAIKIYF